MKRLFFLVILCVLQAAVSAQWQQTTIPSTNSVNCITVIGNNILAGTAGNGIYISQDGGNSWIVKNSGLTNMNIKAITAGTGGHLFAGSNSLFLFTSSDTGNTWTAHNMGGTGTAISSVAVIGSNIFAGQVNDGVFKSVNIGSSWVEVGLCCASVLSLCSDNSEYVFAGTNTSAYRSNGTFTSWAQVNNGLPARPVKVLFNTGGRVYAGTYGDGVYVSDNNGANWTAINDGLTELHILSLTSDGNKIFAGTEGGGVFLSVDNGLNWLQANNGLTDLTISSLAISGSYIYAGTTSSGIWKRPLSEMAGLDLNTALQVNCVVYPNPSQDHLTIISGLAKKPVINLLNFQGQIMLEQVMEQSKIQLDISSLAKGVYLLQVTGENMIFTEKIIRN